MLRYIVSLAVVLAVLACANASVANSVGCSVCVYVAELVDQALNDGKTEGEIVGIVDKACDLFPSELKDQCLAFINEYGPYVLKLVANQIEPLQTCTLLKFCSK